jgi:signal transduction histidine kinase
MDLTRLWAGAFVAYGLAASLTLGVAVSVGWRAPRRRETWLVCGALLALAGHYIGAAADAVLHASGHADGLFTVWSAIGQTGVTLSFEALLLFLLSVVTRFLGTSGVDRWTRRLVLAQVIGGSALALALLTLIVHASIGGASGVARERIASLMYGDGGLPILLLALGPMTLFRLLAARLPVSQPSPWMRWASGNALSAKPATAAERVGSGDWFPSDHFRALSGIYGMGVILIALRFANRAALDTSAWWGLVVVLRLLIAPSAFAVLYYAARPVFFQAVLKHGLLFLVIGGGLSLAAMAASLATPTLSPMVLASAVLGGSVGVYLVGVVLRRANEWLDQRIFQQPDYPGRLNDLLAALAGCGDPAGLRNTVAHLTAEALGAAWARVTPTVPDDSAVAVAIGTFAQVNEFLAVGPRHRGHAYSGADVAFMEAVAAHYRSVLEANRARHAHQLATIAELRALRAQINPHFLFNALTLLAEKVQALPGAERLVLNLAEVFRFALESTQQDAVPLRSELAAIEAYLQIEGERFGDLLRWTIDVPDELRDTPIPPMVLQPLVENSIRHGLAVSPRGGTVSVTALQSGSGVRLTVADDGAGFTPGATRERIGLANVRARVEHAGGTWHLQTAPGLGTTITLGVGAK